MNMGFQDFTVTLNRPSHVRESAGEPGRAAVTLRRARPRQGSVDAHVGVDGEAIFRCQDGSFPVHRQFGHSFDGDALVVDQHIAFRRGVQKASEIESVAFAHGAG